MGYCPLLLHSKHEVDILRFKDGAAVCGPICSQKCWTSLEDEPGDGGDLDAASWRQFPQMPPSRCHRVHLGGPPVRLYGKRASVLCGTKLVQGWMGHA